MPCLLLTLAKRAFVKVLLALASSYSVAAQVNRDTPDHAVLTAYKRVALKVHPDKAGTNEDFQKLQAAKENWERAKTKLPTKMAKICAGRQHSNSRCGVTKVLAKVLGRSSCKNAWPSKNPFRWPSCRPTWPGRRPRRPSFLSGVGTQNHVVV